MHELTTLTAEVTDRIGRLTLTQPDKLNPLGTVPLREIAQAAAWEEKNRVPAEAVPEVLTGFLDEAWDRTEEHVFKIPAPRATA